MNEEFKTKARYDFHKYVMDYLQSTIRLADTKASVIIAILGVAFPVFVNKWQDISYIKDVGWYWLCLFIMIAKTVTYVVSLCFSMAVFRPRLPTSLSKGFIFFMDILGHQDVNAYVEIAKRTSPDDLLESVLYQNWSLSKIVERKFRYIYYAIMSGAGWMALAVLAIVFIPSH